MKATELRIGNYVTYNKSNKSEGFVSSILTECFGQDRIQLNNNILYPYNVDDIEPILLTKEWLMKFGFYQDEKNVCMCLNIVLLRLRIGYGTVTLIQSGESIRVPEIIYVHQLQNLYFALTGKELNFK